MVDKTKPFIAGVYLEVSVGSPTVYLRVCDATTISGIGKTNSEEDSTTFCSNGNREYIAGLTEGSQLSVDLNYVISSEVRRLLMQAVDDRATIQMRLVVAPDDTTPETVLADDADADEIYWFDVAALSYALNPNATAKNTMTWTGRITGEIIYDDNYTP